MKPRSAISVANKAVVIRISPRGKMKRQRRDSLDKPLIEERYEPLMDVSGQDNSNGTNDKNVENGGKKEMEGKGCGGGQELVVT